jgi:hypothetical protein
MTVSLASGVITQTDTDPDLSGFAAIAGVTASVTSGGVRSYIVDSTISRIDINGTLSIDPDIECLVCSESTQIRQAGTTYVRKAGADAGDTWLIQRVVESGTSTTITYAGVRNNPSVTVATTAWTNRATLVYGELGAA